MIQLIRTNSENKYFIELVKELDADLAQRDGNDHAFYAQFNKINKINFAIVAYEDQVAVGCGAIKEYEAGTMEVKRMYVRPAHRGKGIAVKILAALEEWTGEMGFTKCILETGKKQPEAINLYSNNGYHSIPNYGQYANVENSVCFEKEIKY
ncbi:MAG: family N-acetyltransferase [Sediminibacterium sp.]|nr:family N-acetyltransferase [Sediminibacterium sp.]